MAEKNSNESVKTSLKCKNPFYFSFGKDNCVEISFNPVSKRKNRRIKGKDGQDESPEIVFTIPREEDHQGNFPFTIESNHVENFRAHFTSNAPNTKHKGRRAESDSETDDDEFRSIEIRSATSYESTQKSIEGGQSSRNNNRSLVLRRSLENNGRNGSTSNGFSRRGDDSDNTYTESEMEEQLVELSNAVVSGQRLMHSFIQEDAYLSDLQNEYIKKVDSLCERQQQLLRNISESLDGLNASESMSDSSIKKLTNRSNSSTSSSDHKNKFNQKSKQDGERSESSDGYICKTVIQQTLRLPKDRKHRYTIVAPSTRLLEDIDNVVNKIMPSIHKEDFSQNRSLQEKWGSNESDEGELSKSETEPPNNQASEHSDSKKPKKSKRNGNGKDNEEKHDDTSTAPNDVNTTTTVPKQFENFSIDSKSSSSEDHFAALPEACSSFENCGNPDHYMYKLMHKESGIFDKHATDFKPIKKTPKNFSIDSESSSSEEHFTVLPEACSSFEKCANPDHYMYKLINKEPGILDKHAEDFPSFHRDPRSSFLDSTRGSSLSKLSEEQNVSKSDSKLPKSSSGHRKSDLQERNSGVKKSNKDPSPNNDSDKVRSTTSSERTQGRSTLETKRKNSKYNSQSSTSAVREHGVDKPDSKTSKSRSGHGKSFLKDRHSRVEKYKDPTTNNSDIVKSATPSERKQSQNDKDSSTKSNSKKVKSATSSERKQSQNDKDSSTKNNSTKVKSTTSSERTQSKNNQELATNNNPDKGKSATPSKRTQSQNNQELATNNNPDKVKSATLSQSRSNVETKKNSSKSNSQSSASKNSEEQDINKPALKLSKSRSGHHKSFLNDKNSEVEKNNQDLTTSSDSTKTVKRATSLERKSSTRKISEEKRVNEPVLKPSKSKSDRQKSYSKDKNGGNGIHNQDHITNNDSDKLKGDTFSERPQSRPNVETEKKTWTWSPKSTNSKEQKANRSDFKVCTSRSHRKSNLKDGNSGVKQDNQNHTTNNDFNKVKSASPLQRTQKRGNLDQHILNYADWKSGLSRSSTPKPEEERYQLLARH